MLIKCVFLDDCVTVCFAMFYSIDQKNVFFCKLYFLEEKLEILVLKTICKFIWIFVENLLLEIFQTQIEVL